VNVPAEGAKRPDFAKDEGVIGGGILTDKVAERARWADGFGIARG
jgi:hypothetical protein